MKLKSFALTLILCLTTACIHKAGSTPVTPWERVTTDNAVFAQINESVEQGTEAVVSSGLLKASAAAPVIGFTGQVAQIHMQLTAILGKGPNVSDTDLGTITALLNQVQSSGSVLVASGTVGIKNPKTQQSISADIQSLMTLAVTLLSDIQAARTVTTGHIERYCFVYNELASDPCFNGGQITIPGALAGGSL